MPPLDSRATIVKASSHSVVAIYFSYRRKLSRGWPNLAILYYQKTITLLGIKEENLFSTFFGSLNQYSPFIHERGHLNTVNFLWKKIGIESKTFDQSSMPQATNRKWSKCNACGYHWGGSRVDEWCPPSLYSINIWKMAKNWIFIPWQCFSSGLL